MPEYELFLIKDLSELKENEEVVVNVRTTDIIEMRTVRAILSSNPEALPGSDTLWIRWQRGQKHPHPWSIRVLEDMGSLGESVAKEYY